MIDTFKRLSDTISSTLKKKLFTPGLKKKQRTVPYFFFWLRLFQNNLVGLLQLCISMTSQIRKCDSLGSFFFIHLETAAGRWTQCWMLSGTHQTVPRRGSGGTPIWNIITAFGLERSGFISAGCMRKTPPPSPLLPFLSCPSSVVWRGNKSGSFHTVESRRDGFCYSAIRWSEHKNQHPCWHFFYSAWRGGLH